MAFGLGVALLSQQALAGSEWKVVRKEQDGITVEARTVPDTGMPELRLVMHARATPKALVESAWALREKGMQMKYLAERKVLSDHEGERVLLLRYEPPIIKPRVAVLRQVRSGEASGAIVMSFGKLKYTPADVQGSPFAHLRGTWRFEPEKGGSRVTYTILVDVGDIPAFLARGPQEDAAVDTVREVVESAQQTVTSAR